MISDLVTQTGGMIVAAVAIAAVVRNRGWNPSLALLLAGLVVGFVPFGPDAPADPEAVLIVVLAPLVFGEALSSSIVDLRRVSRPVVALAVGLVVFGAFLVGVVAALIIPGIPIGVALCLGAILGPTDAVAVAATAKAAGLPRRLVEILEGESLVNDGTALTLLRVFVVAVAAGTVSAPEIGLILVQSVVGGLAVGVVGGIVLVVVTNRSRDTTVATGVTLIAPFPLYLGAERIHGSGILAVIAAALVLAHATSSAVRYTGRLQSTSVWRTIIFVLQSVAFFLVGLDVPLALRELGAGRHLALLVIVPIVFATLVAARFVFVYAMARLRPAEVRIPRAWIVAGWAGTRGPISGLAAFTLPFTLDDGNPFPHRAEVISITFCVVVLSLLLAPTVAPLARRLRLPQDDDTDLVRHVNVSLARASLDRLEQIEQRAERARRPLPADLLQELRSTAEDRLNQMSIAQEHGEEALAEVPGVRRAMDLEMAHAEQEELLRMRDEEGLPDSLMRQLQKDLDVKVRALRSA